MNLHRKYVYQAIFKLIFIAFFQGMLLLFFLPGNLLGNECQAYKDNSRNPLLVIPTISGPASVCNGASGVVYSTEQGMTDYIWTVSSGGTITIGQGTSSITVSWNAPGNETVTVTYTTATSPGSLNVTVLPVSVVGVSISPSLNPVCSGSAVTFTATPLNPGTTPVYQWTLNGINVGSNSNAFTYIPSNGDIIGCQMTSSLPCTSGNPATAVPVTMVVNTNLPVSVSISASANPVCQGTQVNFLAVPVNGGPSPAYQWKVNGINSGTNSPGFTFLPVNGDVVTCLMTSNASCTTGNPSLSNPVTMSVSPGQPVSIAITASSNPSCQGNAVTFLATPVNGGSSPVFVWKVNGTVTGGNTPTLTFTPTNGDQVTCEVTSNASCATGSPAISNTITMTVNQNLPVSVTITASLNSVCQGNQVTFTAHPVNGGGTPFFQWSINGFNVGTSSDIFTYTPANGDIVRCQLVSGLTCNTGSPATSNPITMVVVPVLPVSITIAGSANPVCVGTVVNYTATPYNGGTDPFYQWKINGSNTGGNSPVFSYIPENGDVVTCQLTSNALCTSGNNATSNPITMTVSTNQLVGVSIAAVSNTVCQGMTADFTATPTNGGNSPAYQWKVNGLNSGTNSPVFSYFPVDGDVVTCMMTSSAICTLGNPATSNAVTITVTQGQTFPVSITINASANPSCLGQQVTYTATPLNGGASPIYQWMVNGLDVGINSPVFTYIPSNGDFVKCQLTSSYICATGNPAFSNQISMTVNPVLAPVITIIASANPSCLGSNVTYTANATNPGTSPIYQWKVNGSNAGTNQATFSYAPANGDTVKCQMTSSVACPVTNPVSSNSIIMSVQPVQPVGISISTNTNPSCEFTQVTFVATPTNGGSSPTYQWKLNGANAGQNSTVFSFIAVTGDVIACQLTSNALCYSGSRTVLSNQIVMSVSHELPVSVSIASSVNPFCQGVPATFTATPTNGGNTPVYQWKVNCANAGSNSPTLNYIPADGDFVTCQMTSSLSCAVFNPGISNAITMKMNTGTPAGISISPSANPVCQSSSVTFTANSVNGGSLPAYQWKVNGVNAGGNSPTFTYSPANGDAITCRLTSGAACVSGSPVTSTPVNMTVSSALPASVSIATNTNPFCQGTAVSFTATPVNGGTGPLYQWYVNGVPSGGTTSSPAFTYSPSNGDHVTCSLTSNSTCISGSNPVVSNQLVMSQAASLPVGISISASANSICQGTQVTYTATPTNGGNTPAYQWKVNAVNTGTNNPVYTYSPANGDVVSCQLTSGLTCATANPATSNPITMIVNPILPVSVSITASINPCCIGTSVTFTATPVNGGAAPSYQWRVNCVNVGTNSPTYTYIPVYGDVVVCILTSNALCNSGSPATSNNINMIVLPLMPVSVTISTDVNPFCIGTPVTFTAVPVNEGSAPGYVWKVNGSIAGLNSVEFTYQPADGDIVTCELTSSLTCVSGNPAVSNPIVMLGNSGLPVSVTIESNWSNTNNTVCQGTRVFYTATPVNGGSSPSYQWKVNGNNAGINNHNFEYTPSNGDVVTCVVTSSLLCANPNPATSNAITMTVDPSLPLTASITASANPSCLGSSVTYTATLINGGTNPVYRWRVNGVNTGTPVTSPTYTYVPVNNDVVLCRVTSNATCATNNPQNSNSITMIVSPTTPANVSIAASANPVCQGTQVTCTATPFNGGTAPAYQWKVNGINTGTNSPAFTYTPVNGDVVTCDMTSNSPCIAITQVTSNPITITVSQIQPVGITIAASSNPTCIASVVTYTATAANGGSSPVYQWKVNGLVVGTNSPTYIYTPVNGDVVTCKLISNAGCSTGNPATSNQISMVVSESLPVSVSISASAIQSCQGQSVTYTATPVNGGATPVYQWRINGIDVGTNNPLFSYVPSNGDFISCQLTSSFSCGTGNPATSNQVSMAVNPFVPVSVSIASSANPVCDNTTVTFSASAINGGNDPVYQWRKNGVDVGSDLSTYTCIPFDGDVIDCELTSNDPCPLGNPVTSMPITMTVLQPIAPGITIAPSVNPACPGTLVTFTSSIVNGGFSPQLQWMINGIIVASNIPVFTYIPADGDTITCQLTSNATCLIGGATAISNQVIMVVNTNLAVNVSITASENPSCQGQAVTYTANAVNGGVLPVYQWMVNGINIGSNDPVFVFTPSNGDVITCQLISDLTCATGNPALSNPITMVISQSSPVGISISVSSNPVCLGSPALFTAVPVNGGPTPVYQWMVNGVPSGFDQPTFTYNPNNGDIITCQVTSSSTCTTGGGTATSNQVVMVVSTDLPVSISVLASSNPVCQGIPVTFTSVTGNAGSSPLYQWKVNGIDVGSGLPTYSYTPLNGDLISCVLTSDMPCATGNPATSNVITMSVFAGQTAAVNIIANPSGPVCQGSPVTFTAFPTNGGTPSYQWYKNSVPVGSNQPAYTCIPDNGDQIYVVMASGLLCVSGSPATSNVITIQTTTTFSASVTITPDNNEGCEGSLVTFLAIPSNGGTPSFQWFVNNIPVGTNQYIYTYPPVNGDLVHVVMTSSLSCVSGNPATSNTVEMIVVQALPVTVVVTASVNPSCEGSTVCYTAAVTNGGTFPRYRWKVNGIVISSLINNPTFCYVPVNGDIVSCQVISDAICPSPNPCNSNEVTMTVNPIFPASVSIAPDQNNICQGTSVTITASATNGGAPAFQWYRNNLPVGLDQASYTFIPIDGDQVHVVMTSGESCVSGSPATSNTVTMTVNPVFTASVSISPDQNNICEGTSITFTATPANGGTPAFQWYKNSVPVGSNQPYYICIPANGDQVYVVMTSNQTCVSGSPATSNTVTMVVSPVLPVSVSIAPDQNNVCQGTSVTFTATPVNGGTPAFQWYKNSVPVGSNQPAYTSIPVNGDQVYVVMTSSMACISGSPATSNTVIMVVNPVLPASVSITADQNNVCLGTLVTFTATPVNGGSPSYQWYKNGLPAGSNQPVYTYAPANADLLYVVMTSGQSCVSGSPATSNTIAMVVNPILPVSVSIAANQNNICQGTSVTFTAIPSNGGIPTYQWYKNSLPVGSNQPAYSYVPASGDQVHVVMTSTLACISGSPATSNTVTMVVNPILPVSVTIAPDQNNVCQGTTVTFTATPANGGTPSYQWYRNAVPVGSNQPAFTCIPVDGDQVYVVMTSSLSCVSGNPGTSNVVTMMVNAPLPVAVTIAPDQNDVCQGILVTFTATPINGGTPQFQWYVNNIPMGTNQPVFSYFPANGEQVHVLMTSGLSCVSGNPATSNTVVMVVNTPVQVEVSIVASQNNICEGTSVSFTATPSNGGTPTYQWYRNSVPVGSNQPYYTYIPADGDQVFVLMNSSLTCTSGNPAASNTISMAVNPILPASVTIVPDMNDVCAGTPVTFTAAPVNGGTPGYQWYKNAVTVGSNQPFYTCIPENGDQVYVVMNSSLSCVTGNPASSNMVTMIVNPVLPVSVSIIEDQNNVCLGTQVTFTATPANGGTPTYQWYRNSVPVGSNQPAYTCIPANGDQVYVVLNSNLPCVSGNPANSNIVTMTVNDPLPVGVELAADQVNVCEGTAVMFTAIPVNGGTPGYQWYKNNVPVGSNQPAYNCIPANGDQVYVVLTSSLTCITGNPATSPVITMVVNPFLPVAVAVMADQNNICQGTSVTFTATPVNGGIPNYQWYKNSVPVGSSQPAYTCIPANGDQVYVVLTSDLPCTSGNPATSNTISMNIESPAGAAGVINGPADVCAGSEGTVFSVAPIANSDSYLWSLPPGTEIVAGINSSTITVNFSSTASSGDITVRGSNSCGSGLVSPGFNLTVSQVPSAPVLTLQWPVLQSSVAAGNEWYFEGILIPDSTGQTFSASEPGWYWAVVKTPGCSSDTSNHVYVDATNPDLLVPGIKVYPVPNDGHFTVSIMLLSEETFNITIYNYLGEQLYELRDVYVKDRYKNVIDIRPVPKGLYTVKFKCPDYEVIKKVLVMMK